MRAPITDKHLLEMMWERFPEIMQRGAEQPAQQEPVATVTSESGNLNVSMSWWHEPALPVGTKLYTSPPAQRTWVGLTDEEVTWLCDTAKSHEQTWGMFARAIEAKLKEKNT